MNEKEIKMWDERFIAPTYARYDLVASHGKGATLYDAHERPYVDFTSGYGVNSLGYSNEAWIATIVEQLQKVQHTSNLYYTEPAAKLAMVLCTLTGMEKVFFANSGAEANECAFKAARKYGTNKREGCNGIITLRNSFHGRTLTALTATGQDVFHKDYNPFIQGFKYVDANNLAMLEREMDDQTCAVMIELIQGEGGLHSLEPGYVQAVARLCNEKDILLIVDEVQTGAGRTGKLFAYEHYGIGPDLVTFAKGIGGGLPIGGCLFGPAVQNIFLPGEHGSTFGANPIACAGAVEVLRQLKEGLLEEVSRKGVMIKKALEEMPGVFDISGLGLMLGFKVASSAKDMESENKEKPHLPPKEIATACLNNGLLVLTAGQRVRLLPPLVITDEELTEGLAILKKVITSFASQ